MDLNIYILICTFLPFRFGIYPLTAYALEAGPVRLTTYQPQSPTGSMDQSVPSERSSGGPVDIEVRRIVNMMCNIKPRDDAQNDFMVSILCPIPIRFWVFCLKIVFLF